MNPQLPISVRFGHQPPGIVVDATFALSRMGLLVTMVLARSANVWLPRGLYALLDNDTHFRRCPEDMGGVVWVPPAIRASLLASLSDELEPWRRAWQNGRLSSRVHWIGDAQYESVLPERTESGLLPRFESCCAALDGRAARFGQGGPLDDCARDVVALAAALQPEATYILTAASPTSGWPPLCDYLAGLGFEVRPYPAHLPTESGAAFQPALTALAASSAPAAIVQIVAPVILAMPDAWDETDWPLDVGAASDDAIDDPWRNTCALWRPLLVHHEEAA